MTLKYLTVEGVLLLNEAAYVRYGGSYQEKVNPATRASIESCLAQPKQILFGQECFPSISDKAAAYLFYITTSHPFFDGNKRTALLCCKIFLLMNNHHLAISEDEEVQLVTNVANKVISCDQLKEKFNVVVKEEERSSF
jgi:death on curing protein